MQNRILFKHSREQASAWFTAWSAADRHGRPQRLHNRLDQRQARAFIKPHSLSAARYLFAKGEKSMQSEQKAILPPLNHRPHPPRTDRIRSIRGSFSWVDHRFLREGFDRGLTRLEKLFYFVLIAVSNRDGVSFYSEHRLAEILDIHHAHELSGALKELIGRDLIAFEQGIYQVLDLPSKRY
jgi:hypothetical protein